MHIWDIFFIIFGANFSIMIKKGRKRPLDTPKRMIERRDNEGEREKER